MVSRGEVGEGMGAIGSGDLRNVLVKVALGIVWMQ